MIEEPSSNHSLRLTGIATSLTSFIFASYTFLLKNNQVSFGKGFFSILIYYGIGASLSSLLSYPVKKYRFSLFYLAYLFIIIDIIILLPMVFIYYIT